MSEPMRVTVHDNPDILMGWILGFPRESEAMGLIGFGHDEDSEVLVAVEVEW